MRFFCRSDTAADRAGKSIGPRKRRRFRSRRNGTHGAHPGDETRYVRSRSAARCSGLRLTGTGPAARAFPGRAADALRAVIPGAVMCPAPTGADRAGKSIGPRKRRRFRSRRNGTHGAHPGDETRYVRSRSAARCSGLRLTGTGPAARAFPGRAADALRAVIPGAVMCPAPTGADRAGKSIGPRKRRRFRSRRNGTHGAHPGDETRYVRSRSAARCSGLRLTGTGPAARAFPGRAADALRAVIPGAVMCPAPTGADRAGKSIGPRKRRRFRSRRNGTHGAHPGDETRYVRSRSSARCSGLRLSTAEQNRSKGRRKTGPFSVMRYAVLRVVPLVHRRAPRCFA